MRLLYTTILCICLFTFCSGNDFPVFRNTISFVKQGTEISSGDENVSIASELGTYQYDCDIYVERFRLETEFEVISDAPISVYTGKTVGYMRFTSSEVRFYESNDNQSGTVFHETVNLPFQLQSGGRYLAGVVKEADSVIFFLQEKETTGTNARIFKQIYRNFEDYQQTLLWGKPFFTIETGDIYIVRSTITTWHDAPILSIFGDSFVEGNLLSIHGARKDSRWCSLVAERLGADKVLIDGKGGERMSESFFNRFKTENNWYRTPYVIIALGTNNNLDFDEYTTWMEKTIAHLKSNGQTPILITVIPRKDYDFATTGARINEWVKNSGERYIDVHQAVTEKGNPAEWREGLVMYDGIHPTPAGYQAIFDRLKIDLSGLMGF